MMICCITVTIFNVSLLVELEDLFSEFPVMADAAARGAASFSHMSAVPVVVGVFVLTYNCSGEVNLEKNFLPEGPLGDRCALLLFHDYNLDLMLDEVPLILLGCKCNCSAGILHSSFQGIEEFVEAGPDMAEVVAVVALRKASLSSV
jgi:hypothetical protein